MATTALNEANIVFETGKIVATAVLTGLFTYWITFKKEREEKKYHAYKELLEKVYTPIVKIINDTWIPGEGYEGLYERELVKIIEVIDTNLPIVEPRLESFVWMFKEEITYSEYMIFDRKSEFLDYINYRYNYLRKKIYLPYDTQYFFWGRQFKRFSMWRYRFERICMRVVRKAYNKIS